MWSSSQRKSSQQLNTQESDFVSLVTKVMSNLLKQMKQHLEESESESLSVMSHSLRPHGLYSPWNSPGQNTGMGSLSLLQGIFLTQGSNPGLPHCRRSLYQLSHKGSLYPWSISSKSLARTWYSAGVFAEKRACSHIAGGDGNESSGDPTWQHVSTVIKYSCRLTQ